MTPFLYVSPKYFFSASFLFSLSQWHPARSLRAFPTVSSLRTVMKNMKLSAEKAMDFMDIPPEDQPKYALLLKES